MSSRPYVETLVFLGGISADVRAWVDEHPDGDRPVAWAHDGRLRPGGRSASAAVAAVRLGRKFVDLVGCVGDDMLGDSIVAAIKAAGVSVRLVDQVPGTATGILQVAIDSKGDRRTVAVPNANGHLGEALVRRADSTIFGADLVHATLEAPLPAVTRVVTTAAQRGVPVLLDATPVPTATGDEELERALVGRCDVLLTNWPAALHLANLPAATGPVAVEVGKRLLGQGAKAVIITMGEHGAFVGVRGQHALVEPFSVPVVDVTGAGEAFSGALAVALTAQARGAWRWDQLVAATRFAAAAAAVCVSHPGLHEALPTRTEVERLLTAQPADRH